MKRLREDLFRELIFAIRPKSPMRMTLVGRSMLPTMRHGDELLVDPPHGTPHVGDVVVFPHRGLLVAHRVIEREARALVCAGDASSRRKERICADDVIGIVRVVRRDQCVVIDRPSSLSRALAVRLKLARRYYTALVRTAIASGKSHARR